jgi:hypothetical protein
VVEVVELKLMDVLDSFHFYHAVSENDVFEKSLKWFNHILLLVFPLKLEIILSQRPCGFLKK